MARVTGPLFSVTASGKLADAIVYSTWKGRDYVRQWIVPMNPRKPKQINVRTAMSLLVIFWQSLTEEQKAVWNTYGTIFKLSGFNCFVRRGMDTYVEQLTTSVTPASVTASGNPPLETWFWVAV